ncbi:hypothetical protein [Alicyclobacillus sendaiensis]|uniref:Uncharacterized protein n=2 Tax=Alicyclobacillus sendaiensis TaxID=192387 RepID=A0ABT6Y0M7_ALISE|nr:hypothetical protein [Alicyclobacillus sendaiensis]MDI9260878.1 hypothetical protein [Alicyclobacillus sendaiensis PA2]
MDQLWAEERKTGRRYLILTSRPNVQSMDIQGLKVVGDTAYWLSMEGVHGDVISTIWSCDLATDHLCPLLRLDAGKDGRTVTSIAVGQHVLWYAEEFSNDPWDSPEASGDLRRMLLSGEHETLIGTSLPLWHAPVLYAATDASVIFEENAQNAPNSPDNPAPYPVYRYRWGSSSIEQWTGRQTGTASGDDAWMVVDQSGDEGQAVLYNLSAREKVALPAPFAYTDGHWVAWWDGAGHLAWAALT